MLTTGSTLTPAQLLETLSWRYATKKFDASRSISAEIWAALEHSLVLTPSSYGLQPWKFLVITDPELKAKLRPVSWGQAQVEDCSHLVVFLVKETITEADIDLYMSRMAEVRQQTVESLVGFKNVLMGDLVNGERAKIIGEWAARQVYIALGNFMTCAALLGVDTCPMEGLEPAKYDQILELAGSGYRTLCACPAGYRAEDDKYATLAKVRFPIETMIEHR
uniref:Nitroreductase n=1 Tax=Cyanothece sp. (strain PCC 7425 / ATCC 29141) TaxID=395961 RepID=B8HK05_CYAP4